MTDSSTAAETGPLSTLRHVAIIMDGNNRWAKRRGLPGSAGHKAGVECIREVLRCCREQGVEVLTLFAFSSENWQRPSAEVSALMRLFGVYLGSEVKKLHRDGVRLHFIGERSRLKPALQQQMAEAERLTAANRQATLAIAVDYGGRWDIAQAARELAQRVARGELSPEQIDEQLFGSAVALADLPPPDLLIRTAGEQRISNFLLWQLAYTELHFTDTLWPDFGERDMLDAIAAFGRRERRFGGRDQTVVGEVSASA